MFDMIEESSVLTKRGYWGTAEILEIGDREGFVCVCIPGREDEDIWARWAIPDGQKIQSGTKVLVAGPEMDDLYIIGLLSAPKAATASSKQVGLRNGASAAVVGPP